MSFRRKPRKWSKTYTPTTINSSLRLFQESNNRKIQQSKQHYCINTIKYDQKEKYSNHINYTPNQTNFFILFKIKTKRLFKNLTVKPRIKKIQINV